MSIPFYKHTELIHKWKAPHVYANKKKNYKYKMDKDDCKPTISSRATLKQAYALFRLTHS